MAGLPALALGRFAGGRGRRGGRRGAVGRRGRGAGRRRGGGVRLALGFLRLRLAGFLALRGGRVGRRALGASVRLVRVGGLFLGHDAMLSR